MARELSNFIRSGGGGAVALRAGPVPSVKDAGPSLGTLRARFAANLDRADIANAGVIVSVVGAAFDPPLGPTDMADLAADKAGALALGNERMAALAAGRPRGRCGTRRATWATRTAPS